jgi:glycosyltransferase involved in cell wall biosynthesis
MDKIKLLVVVTAYQSVVTILDSKLRILSQQPEFNVIVVSSNKEIDENRIPAVPFIPIPISRAIRPYQDALAIVRLIILLKKSSISLIHTHTAKAGFVGAVAGSLCNIPVFHTYHGLPFYPGQNGLAYLLYKFLEVLASRFRTCLFSQNKIDFDTLRGMRSIRCPVYLEGNGVDVDLVQKKAKDDAGIVASIYSADTIKIACIARLEPIKHLEKVIEAVEALKNDRKEIQCIIAGKGPMRSSLEQSILRRNLQAVVSVLYTPYIHALIALADIVVLTSEKEGIPRSLLEAMSLRKPIVATDVVGTNELVQHEITGLLVPFHDQNALKRSLIRLIDDPALRRQFGEAGYYRIIEHYDEKRIVALWVDRYRRCLQENYV